MQKALAIGKTNGIIGASEVGSQIARKAIAIAYRVVIANSRGPETLPHLVVNAD